MGAGWIAWKLRVCRWHDLAALQMPLRAGGKGEGARVLSMEPENDLDFCLLKHTTDAFPFSPQLLPGEEYVCFLLEHPAAEIRPLCVRSAVADLEHPL